MTPTIGRIVHYTLTEMDAAQINRRRAHHAVDGQRSQIHVGNVAREGDVFPMMITRVWGETPESAVNGQVFLDGNDTLWITSATVGEGPRHYA